MAQSDFEKQALQNCEDEPIRTPEAIQPHGCVCVCDANFEIVTHVSQNSENYLKGPPSSILGQLVNAVFDRKFCHAVRNAAGLKTITSHREYLGEYDFGAGTLEVACHRRGDHLIIEMVKIRQGHSRHGLDINRLRWLMSKWSPNDHTLSDVLEITVHDLRMLTGFDRVMAYRFRPDGTGEVIAESLAPNTESFLGLRFPKTDIPKTARAISLEQPLRLIADIAAEDIPLLASRDMAQSVDMTLLELRGTSPVHRKYLSNMGVRASLVVPVVIDGALWGMYSMHHSKPRSFTIQESLSIELIGQMLNAHLADVVKSDYLARVETFSDLFEDFLEVQAGRIEPILSAVHWSRISPKICELLRLDGVIVQVNGQNQKFGLTGQQDLNALFNSLDETVSPSIHASDKVTCGKICGALHIDLAGSQKNHIWCFRREENQLIRWAGAPTKDLEKKDGKTILTPRNSFSEYQERSKAKSRAWEPEDLVLAEALEAALTGALSKAMYQIEIMKQNNFDRETSAPHSLIEISRVIAKPLPDVLQSKSDYERDIGQRFAALVSIYDDLQVNHPRGIDIGTVLEKSFPNTKEIQIKSQERIPCLKTASSLGVITALNELARLFVPFPNEKNDITIKVIEHRNFIECIIKGEYAGENLEDSLGMAKKLIGHLNGDLSAQSLGENCEIRVEIPSDCLLASVDQARSIEDVERPSIASVGNSKNILILDQSEMSRIQMRAIIRKMGYANVDAASSTRTAYEIMSAKNIAFLIVSSKILEEESAELLDLVKEMNIPFAILTPKKDENELVRKYDCSIVLSKPLNAEKVADLLSPLLEISTSLESLNILIVEDNISLQNQIKEEIVKMGHGVHCAVNVPEAEAILRSVSIEAIVLDLFIESGVDEIQEGTLRIVNRIRNEIESGYRVGKDVPILAISGATEIPGGFSPLKTADQIGVDKSLKKPIDLFELQEWITSVQKSKTEKLVD